nr:hypothetical protein CFP56_10092 [Quercus suber]
MKSNEVTPHWLDDYGSGRYQWRQASQDRQKVFHRPIGGVESAFDADGKYHEGRADLTIDLSVEINTSLDSVGLWNKVLLAWTVLRNEHLLLKARSIAWKRHKKTSEDVHFVVDVPESAEDALQDARKHVVLMEDLPQPVEPSSFWFHLQNTARVVDAAKALAKLFVLPRVPLSNGNVDLQIFLVGGHMIMDGLTCMVWARNFVQLLNVPTKTLRQRLEDAIAPSSIKIRLPLPQEALYPSISGSHARQRWWWIITRILRHVRKPLRAGFPNPLTRHERQRLMSLPLTYTAVLDYTKPPATNALLLSAQTSIASAARLHTICRESKVSIGAGCFALAALLMMEIYEQRYPDVPLAERKPFISGFPLNPRAFFDHPNEPDSLMLAFCDGILLPFLPSSLPVDGRLSLLARQAHRQLAAYQKRRRPVGQEAAIQHMGSRGAARVLSNQYLSSLERSAMLVSPNLMYTVHDPQGKYPARPNSTTQTCGVSSVGRRDLFLRRNVHNLQDASQELVANYRDYKAAVRPREGEFLIGIGGDEVGLWVNVSVDLSSFDPIWIEKWKVRFETVLDEPSKEGRRESARM